MHSWTDEDTAILEQIWSRNKWIWLSLVSDWIDYDFMRDLQGCKSTTPVAKLIELRIKNGKH